MSETNCEKNIIGNCEKTGEAPVLPASIGRYYEDTVPDTTDLAEHGRLALSYFINTISTDLNYEMPYAGDFRYSRPPAMRAFLGSLSVCQAKCMEAMAFMRVMCGSTKDLELEAKMVEMMASMLGDDGLYWVYPEQSKMGWLCIPEPYTHIAGQGTMMRAMFTWYQYSGDPVWKQRIDKMVDGIDRLLVVHKDDYAYVPSQGFYDGEYLKTLYVKRGFRNYNEPETEKFGEEGGLFNNFRLVPGPLANWYRLTGNKQALKLSGELIRFALKSKFWSDWKGGEYPGVVGSDHAHWHGGFHGYVDMLRSILEYA
ncbi:MAG: hypothetical protein Q7J78_06130, partial [Clostridiales bacterium]|nr:hypothetical protein [Clostridiales bacterium]